MDNNLINIINNTKADVQKICRRYGIYGNVICYDSFAADSESKSPKLYIVAGTDPALEKDSTAAQIKPDQVVRRNKRTDELFYIDLWAWDMTEGNRMQAFEELMDYGNCIEFLKNVYSKFNTPLPEKIRHNEINLLIRYYEAYLKGSIDKSSAYFVAEKELKKFFRNEKSSDKIKKEWLNFYRSDKYPENKNILKKVESFLNRNSNIVDLDVLIDNSNEIQTIEMDEFEYKIFAEKMKKLYPEITYAISDVNIIDHGGAGKIDNTTEPPTKYVTQEEFAVVLKNRFADEGWGCISNLNPCYWEIRNVHYRKVDEPIIARIYNSITFQYSRTLKREDIDYDGDVSLHKISTNHFMNFVSIANAYNLRYYIDFKGHYGEPSLDFINVITRKNSDDIVNDIINDMLTAKVSKDHKIDMITPSLCQQLDDINKTKDIINSQKRNLLLKKEHTDEKEDKTLF